jgi:hypothetical protein
MPVYTILCSPVFVWLPSWGGGAVSPGTWVYTTAYAVVGVR